MTNINETEKIIEEVLRKLYINLKPKELYEPINYMISIGGKRIRPKLCLLTFSLFQDKITPEIINCAAAIEIFHGFTLIHDDIMDKADLRRGQLTVYKKWNSDIAILAGDVMCIKSYELISTAPADKIKELSALFSDTAAKVCEGQQYDMNFERDETVTNDDYIKMIGLKTAVLIACAAKMGAVLAGADKKICDGIYDLTYQLGLAFQIQDDLFDTFGNSDTFGKTIGGDISNNKKTWLLIECVQRLSAKEDKSELNKLKRYISDTGADEKEKFIAVKDLYISSGTKKAAETAIMSYYNNAIKIINTLSINHWQRELLENFANELIHRTK